MDEIAREQMPRQRQERMQALMGRNNMGTLATGELEELTGLVEQGQRLTFKRNRIDRSWQGKSRGDRR
jgi:hypothetical protein